MWPLFAAILGVGVLAAAASRREEPPGPGPGPVPTPGEAPPADAGVLDAPIVLSGTRVFTVKGSRLLPALKGTKLIPTLEAARVLPALRDAVCNGAPGVRRLMAIDLAAVKTPGSVHSSWSIWNWCVAEVTDGTWGLPGGYYLAVWPHNGERVVFGPFNALVPPQGNRPTSNVQDGLKAVLKMSYTAAKKLSIK